MEFMTGEWFGRLLGVLVVNLILSGDNAVVIAMAARTLEGANRRKAIIWGAAGAVVLRLIFAGRYHLAAGGAFTAGGRRFAAGLDRLEADP